MKISQSFSTPNSVCFIDPNTIDPNTIDPNTIDPNTIHRRIIFDNYSSAFTTLL